MWPRVAKGVFGFLAGLAIWWALTPSYNAALATTVRPWFSVFERPTVTRLRAEGHEIIIDRTDFPPRSARPGIPASDLTFNFILVAAFFAASKRMFSNQNVVRFLIALPILFLTHWAALIVEIQSIYALKLGAWSVANYGVFARNFWGTASHFYRVVGLYAIAFAIWWFLQPSDQTEQATGQTSKRGRKRK